MRSDHPLPLLLFMILRPLTAWLLNPLRVTFSLNIRWAVLRGQCSLPLGVEHSG